MLVVVALEQRPAFSARAAGPGKGLDRRRLQVVPHEHPVGVVAVRRHPAGAQHGAPQQLGPGMMTARLQHAGVVGQLHAVLKAIPADGGAPPNHLAPVVGRRDGGHDRRGGGRRLHGLVVLDVGGQVAAGHSDQHVGTARAAPVDVVGQPPVQHQRRARVHGAQGRRDRLGLDQARVHDDGAQVQRGQRREHLALEGVAGIQKRLDVRRRNPLELRHQRREIVLHAHSALFGRVGVEQDGLAGVEWRGVPRRGPTGHGVPGTGVRPCPPCR